MSDSARSGDTSFFRTVPGILKLTILGSSLAALICVHSTSSFKKKISKTIVNSFHSGCQLEDQLESMEVYFACVEDARFINTYIKAETVQEFNTKIETLTPQDEYYLFDVSFSKTHEGIFCQIVFCAGIIISIFTAIIAYHKMSKTVPFFKCIELFLSIVLSLFFLASTIALGTKGSGHDILYAGCAFSAIGLVATLVNGGCMLLVLTGVRLDNNWKGSSVTSA